jgi:hypothetical protein
MRVLGRLAMAAALMVPIGVVAATSAGASTAYHATCTGASGSIDNVLKNNGVGDNGGLLLQAKGPQQYRLSASGQTCTGNAVSAARVKAVVTTATAVNCTTIKSTTLGGSGTFTWTAPVGMGTSNFNIRWNWTSNTAIHIAGSVSAGGSSNNIFGGNHITGSITTSTSLASTATGGNCSATIPLSHFTITAISYSL